MFANCVYATSASLVTLLNVKLFPDQIVEIDQRKIAVECDWNSKNSQNVQNLGFFGKTDARVDVLTTFSDDQGNSRLIQRCK